MSAATQREFEVTDQENPSNPTPNELETTAPRRSPAKWILLGAVLVILGFWGYVISQPSSDLPDSPLVGRPAYAFQLPDLVSGETVALADFQGRVVILNFWASWCASCKDEVKELETMYKRYRDKDVVVLGIAIQDGREEALGFMQRYGQTFPSLLDPPGEVAVQYGVLGLPETFVIDRAGQVQAKIIGATTVEVLEAELAKVGL